MQAAFNIAKMAVKNSPDVLKMDEANKFLLLPESGCPFSVPCITALGSE